MSALVSTEYVAQQLQTKAAKFCVIDASWRPKCDTRQEYKDKHIPGALFFDIVENAAPGGPNKLNHTLPSPEAFVEYAGKLGVDEQTHVVVYENNAHFGYYSAARAWWMFRVMGHTNVSVMDGGLPLWLKEGRETTDVIPEPNTVEYRASRRPELYKSFADVEENLQTGAFQLMDARPEGMYKGTMPYPREGVEPGHVPNAVSLPFTAMVRDHDGVKKLKPKDQLAEVFAGAGLDLTRPLAAMCGSGVSSTILVLGAFVAGKEDVALFDGSWEEYYLVMSGKNPKNIITTTSTDEK